MRFQVLTPVEVRIVQALGNTMFPREGGLGLSATDVRVARYIDEYLTWLPANERVLVRLMFAMFGSGIALRPRAEREAWLAGWETSRLYPRRVIFQALRSVFTLAYTADPEVLRRMGVEDGSEILERHLREGRLAPEAARAARARWERSFTSQEFDEVAAEPARASEVSS